MQGGVVRMTAGVDTLPSDVKATIVRRVATLSAFPPENDLRREHDFGAFEVLDGSSFWKIAITTTRR